MIRVNFKLDVFMPLLIAWLCWNHHEYLGPGAALGLTTKMLFTFLPKQP